MLDIILDALIDTLKLAPFLLVTIFAMEYLEHRAGDRMVQLMQKAGRFGPAIGTALGCLPQCGFSAACAQLFNGGLVTAGTLIAVFLSTSDEAVPILLAHPGELRTAGLLLLTKIPVALIFGFALDLVLPPSKQRAIFEKDPADHPCEVEAGAPVREILWEAVKRTASVLGFILVVSLVLGVVFEFVGENALAALLLPGFFQPFLTALFGFVPNCAASVLLTELYMDGMISFGSAVAGLCTGAGVGLLVFLKGRHNKKTLLLFFGTLYTAAVLSGLLLQQLL